MRYIVAISLALAVFSVYTYGAEDEPALKAGESSAVNVSSVWDDVDKSAGRVGVNENRGNWFFKSQILKKAINPVKEVQQVVKDIMPYQKIFDGRYSAFKTDLNTFYQDYGFPDVDISTQKNLITEEIKLNEQRLRQPPVTAVVKKDEQKIHRPLPPLPNPSDEIKRLKTNLVDIEKLAKTMVQIRAIENATDEAMRTLSELIKGSREFEDGAWRDYEKISDTLSDVIAEERYRAIEAALANAKNVKIYCAETFEAFFSGLVIELGTLEQDAKASIELLLKRGYAFGKKATEQLRAERQAAADAARERALKAAKKTEQTSWWGAVGGFFVNVWHSIVNIFKSLWNGIAGLFGK